MKIKEAIKKRLNDFDFKIAEAIETGNWKFVTHNIGICCLLLSVFLPLLLFF